MKGLEPSDEVFKGDEGLKKGVQWHWSQTLQGSASMLGGLH